MSELNITPDEVSIGRAVDITVAVTNTNPVGVIQAVNLYINGRNEAEQIIALEPYESGSLTFHVSRQFAGFYIVNVGTLTGMFKVIPAITQEPTVIIQEEKPITSSIEEPALEISSEEINCELIPIFKELIFLNNILTV